MKKNPVKEKSFLFALEVVDVCKYLIAEKKEFILSKQLMRSGTAIGALIREGEYAESKKDFIHKLAIALKEANETEYWILLLQHGKYLEVEKCQRLINANKELLRLLISIINTSKRNL